MKPQLLWADGDRAMARLSQRYFEAQAFEVETVDQVLECLLLLKAVQPDVLAVDARLTWQGRTILDWLTDRPEFYDVPLVLLVEDERSSGNPSRTFPLADTPQLGDPSAVPEIVGTIIAERASKTFRTAGVRAPSNQGIPCAKHPPWRNRPCLNHDATDDGRGPTRQNRIVALESCPQSGLGRWRGG